MGFMDTLFQKEEKKKKYKDFSRKKDDEKRPSIRSDSRKHFYDRYDFKVMLDEKNWV